MNSLTFSIPARIDLIRIEAYIARDSEIAAVNLVDRIEARCRFLAAAPKAGRARPDLRRGARAWAVGSYLVIYRVVGDGVEIMRVIDGRRDVKAVFRRKRA